LAGDAVHIHRPAGGQGMNTGMIDAHIKSPLTRSVRDLIVGSVGHTAAIQRRAARRLKPGQRMPDMAVHDGVRATTLHKVLRTRCHVLVVADAHRATVLADAGLQRCREHFRIVTGAVATQRLRSTSTPLVVLVRPAGHAAALTTSRYAGRPVHPPG
jgi:hypothetical protein